MLTLLKMYTITPVVEFTTKVGYPLLAVLTMIATFDAIMLFVILENMK
jgi:prepilin signal peptidase PulO-like enzyme (type II secretory pathway)